MEYTINKLAQLAGVSTRTLRYYHQVGLLPPARVTQAGYRIYTQVEVDRLQQILFYRELGLELEQIKGIMESPDFDELTSLHQHREHLQKKKQRIDALIQTVDTTIWALERSIIMDDAEKFEGFKIQLIDTNEKLYGEEIREAYGDEAVDASNEQIMGLSESEYKKMEALNDAILRVLDEAFAQGALPDSELAQKAAAMHKEWLEFTWTNYTKEAHAGLADMYTQDERFSAYYDRGEPGKAKLLRDAILIYLGMQGAEPSAVMS